VDAQRNEKMHNTVILSERFAERRAQTTGNRTDDDTLHPLKVGERLTRYVILEQLGGGGMGVVYKALDAVLNRVVALKILPPHLARQGDYHARFQAEARTHARLNHPNVVTLYSSLESAAGDVLVLEYVEGQTLGQRLRGRGPLGVEEAVDIFAQALLGLEHIHHAGAIHRDLKPANIFITRDGTVKLIDFGVAKLTDRPDPSQSGTMVGTLLYISPEQINGRETDLRSDIYTTGISLFEALTGRLPFERRTDYALMHAHVQETPPRPKQYQRRLPAELEWVILKAIEKNPDRRFQTAGEFRDALLLAAPSDHRAARLGTMALRRALWHNRMARRSKLLGGIGFDAFLVATAAAMLIALGVLPLKPNLPVPEPLQPVAAPVVRTVPAPRHAAPAPRAIARIAKSKPAATKPAPKKVVVAAKKPAPKPAKKPIDPLAALHQAWGD
jgi:eukaryotic-like serine/threonine-protein kinase